jgi:hypothetical protein
MHTAIPGGAGNTPPYEHIREGAVQARKTLMATHRQGRFASRSRMDSL